LIDGRQFGLQSLVEKFDYLGVAFHCDVLSGKGENSGIATTRIPNRLNGGLDIDTSKGAQRVVNETGRVAKTACRD